jgi:hypothetical protein
MLFPSTPHLPGPGDRVIIRTAAPSYNPQPATVALLSSDNVWVSLVGEPDPVRIEAVNWWPQVGDKVEVLFPVYINWVSAMLQEFIENHWRNPDDYGPKITRIKKRLKTGMAYRSGELTAMDDRWANVQFSQASSEVMPMCCVWVIQRG